MEWEPAKFCPYSDGAKPPLPLSRREAEVAWWIAEELYDKEIAAKLGVGLRTIHSHREHITQKLPIRGRTGIAVWIREHGVRSLAALLLLPW